MHALIHVKRRDDMNQIENPKQARIAFIEAGWHADIVCRCRKGFLGELAHQGRNEDVVESFEVPGAFDIPLLAKKLAQLGQYDAIIASGFVVDGGIYRHEFVASTVVEALMQVQLETGVPVISAVLTPHQFQEHDPHTKFYAEHFEIKGKEAAQACLEILANFARISDAAASLPNSTSLVEPRREITNEQS